MPGFKRKAVAGSEGEPPRRRSLRVAKAAGLAPELPEAPEEKVDDDKDESPVPQNKLEREEEGPEASEPEAPSDAEEEEEQGGVTAKLIREKLESGEINPSSGLPLHLAVRTVNRELPGILSALLRAGANPNATCRRGRTALHYLFLADQVDPGQPARARRTPLGDGELLDVLEGRVEARTLAQDTDWRQLAALELLRGKADPNAKETDGLTPLHLAVFNCALPEDLDLVRLLLNFGANLNVKDSGWRNTPLSWALIRGSLPAAQLLLQHPRTKPGNRNFEGRTELHMVANLHLQGEDNPEVCECLEALVAKALASGQGKAFIDASTTLNRTRGLRSVHIAATRGCLRCVRFLLAKGSKPMPAQENEQDPDIAVSPCVSEAEAQDRGPLAIDPSLIPAAKKVFINDADCDSDDEDTWGSLYQMRHIANEEFAGYELPGDNRKDPDETVFWEQLGGLPEIRKELENAGLRVPMGYQNKRAPQIKIHSRGLLGKESEEEPHSEFW